MDKRGAGLKYIWIILGIILVLAVIVLIIPNKSGKVVACNDRTFYNNCSSIKPYYCEEGILVEKASVCGCSELTMQSEDSCVSNYQNQPKQIRLNYILRGEEYEFDFTAYKEMYDYVSNLSRDIYYSAGETPSRADFILKSINDEEQRDLLLPLVIEILNVAETEEDAVRIAISLVQDIDYGASNKTVSFVGNEVNYSRYPYEVVYEQKGICGEKTAFLAFLLREMGYETALFYYSLENHEALGIKCPDEKSFENTGYCFIETTGPSIITDNSIEYVGGITLGSEPEIILLSEGETIGEKWHEYRDASILKKIREGKFVLFRNSKFNKLKEKYGLVEDYYVE